MRPDGQKAFTRATPEQRRSDLIDATLEIIARSGTQAATVRSIAAEANVTLGLIRHHFSSKEDLIAAAFDRHMTSMTEQAIAAVAHDTTDPVARLRAFIEAALAPPVTSARAVALWAAFMQAAQHSPQMRDVHGRTYRAYRDFMQELIGVALKDAGRTVDVTMLRSHAIACNAVIDGLWIEGSTIPDSFESGELSRIALVSISKILDLPALEPSA
ncbi:TetR/AcrR family transcriptional regulator [Amaricoccus tamworthensis]|uniref:TetR/AcrR family transcriptional regulator n=1 Tax=Amaricoccus tamworthensis TaxID=57002 RepID=UPI003C7AC3C2